MNKQQTFQPLEFGLTNHRKAEHFACYEACTMQRFRLLVKEGARPIFLLSHDSLPLEPSWWLLLRDSRGRILRVTTPTQPQLRKLTSIRQVYQVARTAGLTEVIAPVHLDG